jgi:two-component system sensor histidine kinase AlgZ
MQWTGLISATLLCLTRRLLSRLDSTIAGLLAYVMLLSIIILLSEGAFHLLQHTTAPLFTTSHTEFLLRNLAIGAIVTALALRYFYVTHQWRQRARTEADARLQALQARIRPHFLFNSINTVVSLIHTQPDAAEEALLDLSDLFRASLGKEQRHIPFSEEVALSRRYLHIETLRLGERLHLEWDTSGVPDNALLPPLILQPLVENAVYHGIEPMPEGGTIALHGTIEAGRLVLRLSNPRPSVPTPRKESNRMALENIRERLTAHYGDNADLKIKEDDGLFHVTLSLPLQSGKKEGA